MSQLITALPVSSLIKIPETVGGVTVSRPYVILCQAPSNPYGTDRVLVERYWATGSTLGRWNSTNTAIKYDDSELNSFFGNEWQQRFAADVLSCIATSTVPCYSTAEATSYTISAKFFAPTPHDEGRNFASVVDPSQLIDYVAPFDGFDDNGVSIKNSTWSAVYWTRLIGSNPVGREGNLNHKFYVSGSDSWNKVLRVRPCCNILASTLVSDEPDEDGYYSLIPDPTDPYIYVRFDASLGTVSKTPLKIRVDLTTEGNPEITSLQVCNNYGDTEPTWETMTLGEAYTFTNTTKETANWEIGVKVVARGENAIRVYEPFAIVQTEVD